MYAEVYSIVEGALDRDGMFHDYLKAGAFVASIAREALEDGIETEVYVMFHHHRVELEDCSCSQYLTDHRPTWTFPADIPDDWDGSETEFSGRFA